MPKRKLFSKSDGTDFITDVSEMKEDVVNFFIALPPSLKKWISEAEDLVAAIEHLHELLKEGQPLDTAIDAVLSKFKSEVPANVYAAIQSAVETLSIWLHGTGNVPSSEMKRAAASSTIQELSGITVSESNLLTEVAVYALKS